MDKHNDLIVVGQGMKLILRPGDEKRPNELIMEPQLMIAKFELVVPTLEDLGTRVTEVLDAFKTV